MSISFERLSKTLTECGFKPVWIDSNLGVFKFGRASMTSGLFEHIWVRSQGKKNEAVAASVVIAVVNTNTATKGLFEESHLAELNTHAFRSYSLVETKRAAMAWESHLGQIASTRLNGFVAAHANALLRRTALVRALIDKYEEFLTAYQSLFDLEVSLKAKASSHQRSTATRLSEWPGVCLFPGGQVVYEITGLTLVSFAREVEGSEDRFANVDPLREPEIMWRIQVLADRLLRRFGGAEDYWAY